MGKKEHQETIYFCDAKKCRRKNDLLASFMKSELESSPLKPFIKVKKMKCQKMCKKAPVYYIKSKDKYKTEVSEKKIKKWITKWEEKYLSLVTYLVK